jgi:hypothetical protein
MLFYEIKNRIGVLQNPQAFDLSVKKELIIHFNMDGIVDFDGQNYKTENRIVKIPVNKLRKGTKRVSITTTHASGVVDCVYPCQPIQIYDINDMKQCRLATSGDIVEMFPKMSSDLALCLVQNEDLSNRINILTKNNKILSDKSNEISKQFNKLSEQVFNLEKNYDPTLI